MIESYFLSDDLDVCFLRIRVEMGQYRIVDFTNVGEAIRGEAMAALRSHNNDFGFLLLTIFVVIASELTGTQAQSEPAFPPASEVEALKEIGKELGIQWNFTQNPCSPNSSSWNAGPPTLTGPLSMFNRTLSCNCSSALGPCHVVGIYLRGNDLPGVLPRSITKLPYLSTIDLHGNYLNGTIPQEWTSTKLEYVFVSVNRLSGPIPSYIANMTFLRCLSIEGNFFTGTVPPELGKLANLECLSLCTNFLTGTLPPELTKLTKLTDLRISGNNFSGRIPDIFQNWKQLQRLEIQASGLEAPIPASIATLANLTILWISDLNGGESEFPNLENMTMMSRLMLRNCNISGQIPSYISKMTEMQILDLSFNRLEGQIPNFDGLTRTVYMYFTHNLLSGSIPDWIKARNSQYNIDLSYNNFSESSEPPSCQQNINLFRSSSEGNDSLSGACRGDLITCSKDLYSVNINCGGPAVTSSDGILYEADQDTGGAAKYVPKKETWGTSSTGLFWDNKYSDQQLIVHNVSTISGNNSGLYTSARASPLSLTYYFRCLADGNYTVTLHFAEIVIRDNRSFYSLGRRIFDVYVQEQLQLPDFNIKNEAQGVDTPVIRKVKTVVKDGTLTVRFHWAGKGTTAAPERGTYGPLISAISVDSDFKPLNLAVGHGGNAKRKYVVAAVVTGSCLIFLLLGAIIWWRRSLGRKLSNEEVLQGLDLQSGLFTYRQIKAATNNFDPENKIGEGGFGAVYKGVLLDGTVIAVKQLSSKSKQGNQEFVNEMGIVSGLQHPNLVRLYGCCIERNELLLVYEYMENNCLGRALFGPRNRLKLDWPTRQRICVGIAKGLAFLHEESRLKIVHRDIKVTNVLLDGNLNAKISDFGLAKLDEVEKTHISTRIAGTIGYMAPEYALWGRLTYKADIYSFGVVALEIVAGKNNMKFEADDDYVCLQDWALVLQQKGKLMDLVDPKLGTDFNREEAVRMIKVALLCTNPSPSLRPIMSSVVRMLEGKLVVPELIMDPTVYGDESRFRALRDQLNQIRPQEEGETQHLIQSSMDATGSVFTSSASADDF